MWQHVAKILDIQELYRPGRLPKMQQAANLHGRPDYSLGVHPNIPNFVHWQQPWVPHSPVLNPLVASIAPLVWARAAARNPIAGPVLTTGTPYKYMPISIGGTGGVRNG